MPPKPKIGKKRLDLLVVERGAAESRQKAQAMILAGEVQVNGVRSDKAGALVPTDARIEIKGNSAKYASRGGFKLEGALLDFGIIVNGKDLPRYRLLHRRIHRLSAGTRRKTRLCG